jgi:hypothetical protein
MLKVNLSNLHFLNKKKIENLNHFVAVNRSLMPHSIAVAVGCSLEEATTILLLLYGRSLVDGFILVYHLSHLDVYFEKREISEGFSPRKAYSCPVCQLEHTVQDELYFDFEFNPRDELEFVVET